MNESYTWILQSVSAMVMIAITVASVLGLVLVVVPQAREVWDLKQEIDVQKVELNQLAEKVASLSELDAEDIGQRLAAIVEVLPDERDIPYIISTLKQLADEYQVELKTASAVVEEDYQPKTRVSGKALTGMVTQLLSMTVEGEVESMVSYIEDIERVIPLIKVSTVDARKDEQGLVQANLVVETYVMYRPVKLTELGKDERLPFEASDVARNRVFGSV
jgi:Tfp pilus assembly protein PilO